MYFLKKEPSKEVEGKNCWTKKIGGKIMSNDGRDEDNGNSR